MRSTQRAGQGTRATRLFAALTLSLLTAVGAQPGASLAADHPAPNSSASTIDREQRGYPRQTHLETPTVNVKDAAGAIGLTGFHEIAPALNAAQEASDRVSVEVIGHSVEGRDLYLVTLTAPESASEARQQSDIARDIRQDPEAAAARSDLQAYKVPVFVGANIHGDEWEGTDGALRLVQNVATAQDPAIERVLSHTRIHLVVSINPDGRVANTRHNAAGFDLNRDFLTASQPETVAVRDAILATQPILLIDLHGYANGTLIEPPTPQYQENIEIDLEMKHAYPHALAIEAAIGDVGYDADDGVRPPQSPLRDWNEGWDGWAPVFTGQYAALHGAIGQTVELPLKVNNDSYVLPRAEVTRRTAINTDIAVATIEATLGYADTHRRALTDTQIEWFRRAVAGEPARAAPPTAGAPALRLIDGSDPSAVVPVEPVSYPRGYIIPMGSGQRSAPAATRLVEHLIANGVTISRATSAIQVDGVRYPSGSFLIDMRQAKRGVAAALLDPGTDTSSAATSMYDIAGWSAGSLWGARVVRVMAPAHQEARSANGGSALQWPTERVRSVRPGSAKAIPRIADEGPWRIGLQDSAEVAAINELLRRKVALTYPADGTAVFVPAETGAVARDVAAAFAIPLPQANPDLGGGNELGRVRIAAAASEEELFALREMGFEVTPVSAAILNNDFDFASIDTFFVSQSLSWSAMSGDAQLAMVEYLQEGGGVVAAGRGGLQFNQDLDLLPVQINAGPADANGVVAVQNGSNGLAGNTLDHAFIYGPSWFTDVGENVVIDQRYVASVPLVSGHWRAGPDGSGGQSAAAGEAVMVHGVDAEGETAGAAVALIGSEPLFRAHPKGQYALVARALLWTSQQAAQG